MGLREWIIPQDRVFFDLLERHMVLTTEAVTDFRAMVQNWANMDTWRSRIAEVEHQADQVSHEVFDRLNRTFITPIDREDIARLTHALDDVVDAVDAAATRIALLHLPEPTPAMSQFVDVLSAQVAQLQGAVQALRKPATLKALVPGCVVEIHRLENNADQILNDAIGELFAGNDAIRILKYKEIYEFLEWATDYCEDAADILQDILRKNG